MYIFDGTWKEIWIILKDFIKDISLKNDWKNMMWFLSSLWKKNYSFHFKHLSYPYFIFRHISVELGPKKALIFSNQIFFQKPIKFLSFKWTPRWSENPNPKTSKRLPNYPFLSRKGKPSQLWFPSPKTPRSSKHIYQVTS